jgi:hypothetical protein
MTMEGKRLEGKSPYLKPGRLADVLAALQIMAAGQRPEGRIDWWVKQLSPGLGENQTKRWTAVFQEHPEFFLVYSLENDAALKAALRWRYTNKLYDHKTGKEYTQQEKEALPQDEQYLLTTRPMDGETVSILLKTAIELHSRAIEEFTARRWWVTPAVGFGGVAFGALLTLFSAFYAPHASSAPAASTSTAQSPQATGR